MVTNLLSNAIKFCDETNGIIKIEVEKTSKNIILNIYNNGKTINADDLEIIFDKLELSNFTISAGYFFNKSLVNEQSRLSGPIFSLWFSI